MDNVRDREENTSETRRFVKDWVSTFEFSASKDKESILHSIKTLENSGNLYNNMFLFYETKSLIPLFVSKNIKAHLGYTAEEFIGWRADAFNNIGSYEQLNFWEDLTKWIAEFVNVHCKKPEPVVIQNHYIGRVYKHKNGKYKKFFVHTENLLGANNEFPSFICLRLTEITHLMKGDDYWVYLNKKNSKNEKVVSKFYSRAQTMDYALSAREKEIIQLIATGMSSKEVAQKLFISIGTVSQHRKNAIKRLCAKDTSSLIQICKLCEII